MKVICDIECNSLNNVTKIWLIVCKTDTGEWHIFRNVLTDEKELERWRAFAPKVSLWVGHNFLGYDAPILNRLTGTQITPDQVVDTLIVSKLVDYSRKGHSIEDYGIQFGIEKGKFNDFTKLSEEMETYCIRDVDICELIYKHYASVISAASWQDSLRREHRFQVRAVNTLHDNGFAFDQPKASKLLDKVTGELATLDEAISGAFPPREVLVKEFTPRVTKHGTISKTSVPRQLWDKIHEYEVGRVYPLYRTEAFNPSSHKQLISVLNSAGWLPTEKTQTHIDCERERNRLRYQRKGETKVDLATQTAIIEKLEKLETTGWKINEANLSTLPPSAPEPARLLAKRILLESRRRTLTEWLGLCTEAGRIHGKFYGIGAWTHRMAHQQPNTANIPSEFREDGSTKLLGKEMRSLWRAPRNKLLVGVDAEGIQLRIFAHYINDQEFTDALVHGRKEDKTDPHSLNQRILGDVCKTRQAAKRFIYALLLGAGMEKLAQILGCSVPVAKKALDHLLERYTGFAKLKREVIPKDAKRGFFTGLDGRRVAIPGLTESERGHLCMSGYLQNGEKIVMAETVLRTLDRLDKEEVDNLLVNIVHDEVLFEINNSVDLAKYVGKVFCEEIENVGKQFNLICPLAGDAKYGINWYQVH